MTFDAIYSGFLARRGRSPSLRTFTAGSGGEHTLVLVDPVMGDHGKPYRTYTPDMCARMGELGRPGRRDHPHLTEAALLLGEPYEAVPGDEAGLRGWLERLSLEGRRSVVLTGVSLAPGQVGAGWFDRGAGRAGFTMTHQEPGPLPRHRRPVRQRGAGLPVAGRGAV